MVKYLVPTQKLIAMLFNDRDRFKDGQIEGALLRYLANAKVKSPRTEAQRVLGDLLFYIWSKEWPPTGEKQHCDPTMIALAYTKMKHNGTFADAKDTTNSLAALTWTMRVIFLRELHQRAAAGPHTIGDECQNLKHWWSENIKDGSFTAVRSLQHYASSNAMRTTTPPRVTFFEEGNYRRLDYQGDRIDLEDLATMLGIDGIERSLVDDFYRVVLFGMSSLAIDYKDVADDLGNKAAGHSFLVDARNPFHKHKGSLLQAVLNDAQWRSEYIMEWEKDDEPRFNKGACRRWLGNVAEWELMLMTRCMSTAGAPPRGTEMCLMRFCNTETRERNAAWAANYFNLVGMYTKTSSSSGHDHYIPHALDALSSALLTQHLALVRPLMEVIAQACFVDRPDRYLLYGEFIFVNCGELFETSDITGKLEELTEKYLGVALGVNDTRHLTTAFRRELLDKKYQHLDTEYEFDTAAAELAGHSVSVDKRVYGRNSQEIWGTGQRDLALFRAVAREWQLLLNLIPCGLILPVRKATSDNYGSLVEEGIIKIPVPAMEVTAQLMAKSVSTRLEIILKPMIDSLSGQLFVSFYGATTYAEIHQRLCKDVETGHMLLT